MLLLASAPLLFFGSCTENDLVVSAEGGEEEQVAIVPEVAYNAVNGSNAEGISEGPVNDLSIGMQFGFERGDKTLNPMGTAYYWAFASNITGTCEKTEEDVINIAFTPRQFYLANGDDTRMRAWYPSTGVWALNQMSMQRTVTWSNLTGQEDIMLSNELSGNKANEGINGVSHKFKFSHKLTQLQLYVCAENTNVQARLGNVTSISIANQPTSLYYNFGYSDAIDESNTGSLEKNGTTTTDFSITKNVTLGIYDEEDKEDYGATFAGSIMILPGQNDLSFSVTTVNRPDEDNALVNLEDALENYSFEAGNAYKVVLILETNDIYLVPQPTPTTWITKDIEVDLGESDKGYPYVESERYIVSRDYFGSADFSGVTGITSIRINEKWTANEDCTDATSVPAILEVGPLLGEGTEATATSLETAKGLCPAGWRLPTQAELLLIRQVQTTEATALGDRALAGNYWTVDGSTVNVGTGEVTENASTGNVRCVRDI